MEIETKLAIMISLAEAQRRGFVYDVESAAKHTSCGSHIERVSLDGLRVYACPRCGVSVAKAGVP